MINECYDLEDWIHNSYAVAYDVLNRDFEKNQSEKIIDYAKKIILHITSYNAIISGRLSFRDCKEIAR